MKLNSGWKLSLAGLVFAATAVVATPAQHAFVAHHEAVHSNSSASEFPPVRGASASLASTNKWTKIETMEALPNYQLRIKEPKLCNTNTTQYSGYLDTDEDRHFFFWFFEARNAKREDAPIVLWMNGGPGCSSFTGLLMELGPCRVDKGGKTLSFNKYGWDDKAH
ncbi:hypothetical protein LPJ57_011166, partial [Coemansia sp. RSA 486]